jgi:hypothetical protein
MALSKKTGKVVGVIREPRPVPEPTQTEDQTDGNTPLRSLKPPRGVTQDSRRGAVGRETKFCTKEILGWNTAYPFV